MNITQLKEEFVKRFGAGEMRVFAAPGRVNMIGEHTDYNGGFVFPAAITLGTTIIARKRNDRILRMCATDLDCMVEASLDNTAQYKTLPWGNYQVGVADELERDGITVCGCDMLFHDTTPHGGGLSSSAAIEVATALCLYTLSTGKKPNMVEMAKIGQRAENNYVGVNCGIMDQFASAMGKKDHVIFLDCKDLSYSLVPLRLDGIRIVIANTNKKRSLITSKYNERRSECEQAVAQMQKAFPQLHFLGELTAAQFEENKHLITDATVLKRAAHVIAECDRVKQSVRALEEGKIEEFGQLMNKSHDSLRDLYEVTGEELDALVNAARAQKGCIGARMTGAGFGGCTVNLVQTEDVEVFQERVAAEYTLKIGYAPSFYVTDAGDGGREIQ